MGGKIDYSSYIGKKYGRLTILSVERINYRTKYGRTRVYASCICECGNSHYTHISNLISGNTLSCGCLHKECMEKFKTINKKHGGKCNNKETRTYKTWEAMKTRCYNPNRKDYVYYGGRGIKVCDRWLHSFENFLEDMGERPENTSLDRIDNNGDYEPSNCRWLSHKEQCKNRKNSRYVIYKGETMLFIDFIDLVKLDYRKMHNLIFHDKLSPECAIQKIIGE